MTTPAAAIYGFMSSFQLPAYEENSVPDDAEYPYLTYSLSVGSFDDGNYQIEANLWYRTSSEAIVNAKVQQIREYIGNGGIQAPCEDGTIWIKRGNPFCQNMSDPNDDKIKRRFIILYVEYLIGG